MLSKLTQHLAAYNHIARYKHFYWGQWSALYIEILEHWIHKRAWSSMLFGLHMSAYLDEHCKSRWSHISPVPPQCTIRQTHNYSVTLWICNWNRNVFRGQQCKIPCSVVVWVGVKPFRDHILFITFSTSTNCLEHQEGGVGMQTWIPMRSADLFTVNCRAMVTFINGKIFPCRDFAYMSQIGVWYNS